LEYQNLDDNFLKKLKGFLPIRQSNQHWSEWPLLAEVRLSYFM
jgi:hypothetical protein